MSKIDHPHHAENDREPDRDQRQARGRVENLDDDGCGEIHWRGC